MTASSAWWTKNWNVVDGCSHVSPACNSCYAEMMSRRFWRHRHEQGDTHYTYSVQGGGVEPHPVLMPRHFGNLMLCASQRDHVRLHHGWRIVDGQWWKPCTRCGEMKPVEEFYPRRTGTAERMGQCRLCQSATARERVAKRVCERCGAEYRPAFGGQKFCEECRA